MSARAHENDGDPELLELVRGLDRRDLSLDKRSRLLRLLVRRLVNAHGIQPLPELIELLTPNPGDTDALDPILALYTAGDHAATEEAMRLQLLRLVPVLSELLRKARFVLDYVLVVPRNHDAERWAGRRRQPRAPANVSDGDLVDGHPVLLDRAGRVCLDLWPLMQAMPPTEGAEPELFVLDAYWPDGALLIAAPPGFERQDSIAGDWMATHVIAEIESKSRVREHLRIAARQWQNRGRQNALLWRGEVLADFERWMRHATGAVPLDDLEAAFAAASRRAGRRTRWLRRLLATAAVAAALGGVVNHFAMKARMAEQIATQAEVEQGATW